MKKIIMIAITVVFSMTVNAQNSSSGRDGDKSKINHPGKPHQMDATQRATRLTEYMAKKLLLTEAQKKDVFNINLNKAKKIEALHAMKGADKKALGAQRKAIEQERDAELRRVLSVEQYEKWMKLKAGKKKNKKGNHEKGNNQSGKVKSEKDNDDDSDGDVIDQMERE